MWVARKEVREVRCEVCEERCPLSKTRTHHFSGGKKQTGGRHMSLVLEAQWF